MEFLMIETQGNREDLIVCSECIPKAMTVESFGVTILPYKDVYLAYLVCDCCGFTTDDAKRIDTKEQQNKKETDNEH